MTSLYEEFDRARLRLKPLAERRHLLHLDHWLALEDAAPEYVHPDLTPIARKLVAAREAGAARILMAGGHLIRAGVARHLIDLIERGVFTRIALNGAGMIHDYELARIGATTESVAQYIASGQFGLWQETGELNRWIAESPGLGLGELVGRRIAAGDYPHRDLSVLAAAYRCRVPATVHVGIGYDIIHEHPNCDGAALGAATYHDFLVYAKGVEQLEGGVVLSFGSAVMAPEVFLKALAMARNVAHQEGRVIRRFTTAVFDLIALGNDWRRDPSPDEPGYYFRPRKTLLQRTVADGGQSYYVEGHHRATLPALWRKVTGRP